VCNPIYPYSGYETNGQDRILLLSKGYIRRELEVFVSGNAHHRITHSKSGGQHMEHRFIPVQIRNILRPIISIIKRYLENNLLSPKPPSLLLIIKKYMRQILGNLL
jgi:hypothetical protein